MSGGKKHHLIQNHAPHAEEHGEGNWLVSYADMMTLLVGFFVILLSFSKVDDDEFEKVRKAVTVQFGGSYTVPFGETSDRIREALKKEGLGDQVIVKQNEAGVEISFLGTVFFNTGSADIKAEGSTILNKLIPIIKGDPELMDLTVEGHTDDVPIGAGLPFQNNWELSSVRACRVLSVFSDQGFIKNRLMAVGYADTKPIVPNRDANGNPIPKNQSQNRRVVIRLNKHSEKLIPSAPSDEADEASQSPEKANEPDKAPKELKPSPEKPGAPNAAPTRPAIPRTEKPKVSLRD